MADGPGVRGKNKDEINQRKPLSGAALQAQRTAKCGRYRRKRHAAHALEGAACVGDVVSRHLPRLLKDQWVVLPVIKIKAVQQSVQAVSPSGSQAPALAGWATSTGRREVVFRRTPSEVRKAMWRFSATQHGRRQFVCQSVAGGVVPCIGQSRRCGWWRHRCVCMRSAGQRMGRDQRRGCAGCADRFSPFQRWRGHGAAGVKNNRW